MRRRQEDDRERGVSEVLSVLLMVSVTIVLAAMVGSVMLNVVGGVDDNPVAGATITFDGDSQEITVVYTAAQDGDTTLDVKVLKNGTKRCSKPLGAVGDEVTFSGKLSGCLPGSGKYTVRVIAKTSDGDRAVVQEEDGSI
jgi:flagellin-like protein